MAEPGNAVVVLLGMGIVFAGLIVLVLICKLMGAIVQGLEKSKKKKQPVQQTEAPASQAAGDIQDRGAFMAAISAAIAEELGTDVNGIRILSVKKL